MAMSMRTGGPAASTTTTRPRPSDEYKPLIESKEDPEAHTVYIRLPGFSKAQIRIVAESRRGVLRVGGERFIDGSRWSRFHEEVPVPDNCDITETRAKFEGGVLRITMPKTIQSLSPAALSDEATTPERSPPRPPPVYHPQQPYPASERPAAKRPVSRPQSHPAPAFEPRPVSALPQTSPAPRPVIDPPPRTPPRQVALPPPPAPRPALRPPPQPRTPAAAVISTVVPPGLMPSIQPKPRDDHEAKPKQSLPMSPWQTPPPEITPVLHPILRPREDEKPEFEGNRKPSPLPPKPTPASILQALPQPDPAPWMEKQRTETKLPEIAEAPIKRAGPKAYEPWKEEEGMKVRRRMGEDRQLLLNIGAAVMVIMGLGAWISYSFRSPANTTN